MRNLALKVVLVFCFLGFDVLCVYFICGSLILELVIVSLGYAPNTAVLNWIELSATLHHANY